MPEPTVGPRPPEPPQPHPTPREAVIRAFKDTENAALQRHTAIVGSDGCGNLRILCGCELGFNPDAWQSHIRAVRDYARRPKPQTKRG